jgi:hypothetical protein
MPIASIPHASFATLIELLLISACLIITPMDYGNTRKDKLLKSAPLGVTTWIAPDFAPADCAFHGNIFGEVVPTNVIQVSIVCTFIRSADDYRWI